MMTLYLHGFRSSPDSFKAKMLHQAFAARGLEKYWRCPSLPASPSQAIEVAQQQALDLSHDCGQPTSELTLVGSSLGGFYAIVLAEALNCRAVLINPAVHAARDLATQVGEHRLYHSDEPMTFLPSYVQELVQMSVAQITDPERYLLIAATGDELLDWREMTAFMTHAHQIIVPGSDHGLSDFENYLPEVLRFAGITD
jgi:predicted esterase YcpF (UPF0227 family)